MNDVQNKVIHGNRLTLASWGKNGRENRDDDDDDYVQYVYLRCLYLDLSEQYFSYEFWYCSLVIMYYINVSKRYYIILMKFR